MSLLIAELEKHPQCVRALTDFGITDPFLSEVILKETSPVYVGIAQDQQSSQADIVTGLRDMRCELRR